MIKKLLVGLVVLLAVLIGGGALYQWLAQRADDQRFSPPGRLLTVDGLTMHVDCRGSGRPVIILEAGLTAGSWSWGTVFDALAQRTEVCAYDRPGMGWSEPINRVADAGEVADRLHGVIQAAAIEGPYVLLGMSAGGVYVREYYARHPHDVVGMVLVDSAHEQQGDRLPPLAGREESERMLRLCTRLQPIGVVRALDGLSMMFDRQPGIPEEARPLLLSRVNQSHYCASMLAELESFDGEIHDPQPPSALGDLPLLVLSQGKEPEGDETLGLTAEQARAQRLVWNELQEELAALSTHGRRLIAEHSGHPIQFEQPELLIDAVGGLIDELRDGHQ